ncbi:MAG TPA: cell envelope integrity EipB family protein [Rhizobiaceae bacterium]|nr:cell envelope integrity EipB family protein [Rhizobiaceae bacterium]
MPSIRTKTIAILAMLAAVPISSGAGAAGFEILAPHRAVYDIKLREASDRSGIEAMTGRIVYEVTGNECEGMSIRYRFVTNISTGETSYQTDQQTSTFESPDGNEFTFVTKTLVDQRPEGTVRGNAMRMPGSLKVTLFEPKERTIELPDASFISTHLIKVIENARNGENFLQMPIFDGSQDADEIVRSSTVIGKPREVAEAAKGEVAEALRPIANAEAWPVTVSYFEGDPDNTAEVTPAYEASFLLYANGISRNLVMRYPDYSLTGELTALEMLKATPCVQNQ